MPAEVVGVFTSEDAVSAAGLGGGASSVVVDSGVSTVVLSFSLALLSEELTASSSLSDIVFNFH